MRRLLPALVLAAGLAAPVLAQAPAVDVKTVVGPPHGSPLGGRDLDRKTAEVASLLRCPVCQGLSVADSPAGMAVSMRGQVREMLAQGYDADQVLTYFESSYGEFVRLKPPLRGVNWLVWLAPAAVLLCGALVVRRALQRRAASEPAPADPDALPEDARLAAAVLRVREMAYGWPGGRRP